MKIPKSYRVGGQLMNVDMVDSIEGGRLGDCCVAAGQVRIAKYFDGRPQSESSQLNTFYHELTHSILDTMGRSDLSQDENFVCAFSSFLTEALTSLSH